MKEIKINYNEWNLWSKFLGKIVILNGISCSGKTTFSRSLMEYGVHYISLDDVIFELYLDKISDFVPSIVLQKLLSKDDILSIIELGKPFDKKYDLYQKKLISELQNNREMIKERFQQDVPIIKDPKIFEIISTKTKYSIYNGYNVVIDVVISEEDISFLSTLIGRSTRKLLLYTPLDNLLNNCCIRNLDSIKEKTLNYRTPAFILEQFFLFFQKEENGDIYFKIDKHQIDRAIIKSVTVLNFISDFLHIDKKSEFVTIEKFVNFISKVEKIYIKRFDFYDLTVVLSKVSTPSHHFSSIISNLFNDQSDNKLLKLEIVTIPSNLYLETRFKNEIECVLSYKEWEIWSKCYGKILMINGISSSGKTTLTKSFISLGFYHFKDSIVFKAIFLTIKASLPTFEVYPTIQIDDINAALHHSGPLKKNYSGKQQEQIELLVQNREFLITQINKHSKDLYHTLICGEIKKYVTNGYDVVIESRSKEEIQILIYTFSNNLKRILLYTPLDITIKNTISRNINSEISERANFRVPNIPIKEFLENYKFTSLKHIFVKIDRAKILQSLDQALLHLKHLYNLHPNFFNNFDGNIREIEIAKQLFSNNDRIYFEDLDYDLIITLPKRRIENNFVNFLYKFIHEYTNSVSIDLSVLENIIYLNDMYEKHLTVFPYRSMVQQKTITFIKNEIYESLTNYLTYKRIVDKIVPSFNSHFKKLFYFQELAQFKKILQHYNIEESTEILLDYTRLKKHVLFKLHPDKGGNEQDFKFVKNLYEKFSSNLDILKILDGYVKIIEDTSYKSIKAFKFADLMLDGTKLILIPTLENFGKTIIDVIYLSNIYLFQSKYSLYISNSINIAYKAYQGEVIEAIQQSIIPISCMFLMKNTPYITFFLGVTTAIFTGYDFINNAYSFYLHYNNQKTFSFLSYSAYEKLYNSLSRSPAQFLYDFKPVSENYRIMTSVIHLDILKNTFKNKFHFQEEFQQKLYDYILKPFIEQQYQVSDSTSIDERKFHQDFFPANIGSSYYDHCTETKNPINENIVIYYCFNSEYETLDRIFVDKLGSDIEFFEHL